MPRLCALLLLLAPVPLARAGEDGFVPMFNGRDLAGWVNVNCAPGTFFVKDGEIITTGKPTGYLRTARQYENFIADFEWIHLPPAPDAVGNSGFFVWADPIPAVGTGYTRGIEVQVLVNLTYRDKKTGALAATSQGDLFSIWGATCVPDRPHPDGWARCLPSGNYAKGENEWNHYRVEANGGRIELAVNGHVVSGVSKCNPRKGYLALESEGSECHFKNLKIKELPSTNPKPEEIADVAQGFHNLYTGLDLSGWQAKKNPESRWQVHDCVLHHRGKAGELRTEKEYGDAEFILDFRFPKKDSKPCLFMFRGGNEQGIKIFLGATGLATVKTKRGVAGEPLVATAKVHPSGQWNRMWARVTFGGFELKVNDAELTKFGALGNVQDKGPLILQPQGEMDFGNLFVRELKR